LRARWQRGERVGIEVLGEPFDQVQDNDEQLLDLLYHEVLIREEFGHEPDVDEFVARFPKIEDRLRRQFEVHAAVDQDWRGDGFELTDAELLGQLHQQTIGADGRTSRLIRMTADLSAPPGYELIDELGRGGMAIVFKARQQSLNRLVALKMILAGQFATEQALARFRQEAQAVAQLQHAGIVQIHEVGEHQGLPFLSLEYVPGGTLQQTLNGRPLPDETAARLIESLARTMHFAHERGVIHRDLKPANVLLTNHPKRERGRSFQDAPSSQSSGASALAPGYGLQQTLPLDESLLDTTPDTTLSPPKISDFGLARLLNGDSDLTTTGQVIGTPSYMAPEQAGESNLATSPAPDVYSLGAILYETLTGRPPFQAATILQTLEQVRGQEPVPPRQLQPRLPVDLETICLKCLEKSPARRYPTALALADDLSRFLNHEPITARPSGMIERSRKWIHRRPAVAVLLTLIVVLTIFGWTAILREVRHTNLEALRANQNEATARRERDQADKERRIAETERENGREAQARAEANFLKATEVVTKFSGLGNQLQNEARQQQTSRRIFDAALQFYENVLVERGDDPLVRFQAASAYLRAGEIREILGQQDHSAKLIDRAVELLEGLVAEESSVAHRRELVIALRLQASNARHFVDLKKAETAYVRCLDVTESLVRDNSDDRSAVTQRGKVRVGFGVMLKATERQEESLTLHREAVDIFRSAITRWPMEDSCEIELTNALHGLAAALWYFGRLSEAEPLYRECFERSRTLLARLPNHLAVRTQYARSLLSMTRLDIVAGELDTAAARMDEAAQIMNEIASNYPDNINYLSEFLWIWQDRLLLEHRRNIPAQFERASRMELDLLGNLLRRLPPSSRYEERFALATYRFADWLWLQDKKTEARDQYAVALQVLKQVTDRLPQDASVLHQLAWYHAVCPIVELRDIPLAETLATRATELSPNSFATWQSLGAAQLRAADFSAAETSLGKALSLSPNSESSAAMHALLAVALHQQNRSDEAEAELL
ncbi:MAG: protein kinase, partial [Planctomycetaceae bacterium]|nr:protein kinase [Planctomycetaceae bacterium]